MSKQTKNKLPDIQIINPASGKLIAIVSGDEIVGFDNGAMHIIHIKKAGKTVGLVPNDMVVIWNS